MSDKSYSVGYGKPPAGSQFKSGKSGNPKGRPQRVKNLATELTEELLEMLVVTEGGKQRRVTKQRAMLKALLAKSLKGDASAANTLLKLVPSAEQAQQTEISAKNLSPSEQEILDAYFQQRTEALNPSKSGDVS